MTVLLPHLPLGQSDYFHLRRSGSVYVDKTELVCELASSFVPVLLIRPRGFGKSLLVSTLESLFRYGLRDFRGLAIEKLWKDRTYNVVRLDFSDCKQFADEEEFRETFSGILLAAFAEVGFRRTDDSMDLNFQISAWMSELERGSLVVLIDEYDAPLTACWNDVELFKAVRGHMSDFFATLKSEAGCLRFLFLTGTTKCYDTSIFSNFDPCINLSLDPKFGTLLGFTKEEILRNFPFHLERAAESLGQTTAQLLDNLLGQYGGYCFEDTSRHRVACPWSVLHFLDCPERGFQNDWFAGSDYSTVLHQLLKHEQEEPASFAEPRTCRLYDLASPRPIEDFDRTALLTQAGGLTIKEIRSHNDVILGYPNREVTMSMAQLYADKLLDGKKPFKKGTRSFEDILAFDDTDNVVVHLNNLLETINHMRHPISDATLCARFLQVLMMGAQAIPQVESHSDYDRGDLEVETGDRHWVFELKFAKEPSQVEKLLSQAVGQIRDRQYGETPHGKELRRVALVYSAQDRRFTAWQDVGIVAE